MSWTFKTFPQFSLRKKLSSPTAQTANNFVLVELDVAGRAISIFDSLNTLASSQVLHTSVYKFTADFLTNLEKLANPNNSYNWIHAARRNPPCQQL